MERRKQSLVNMGHAVRLEDGRIRVLQGFHLPTWSARRSTRVGKAMAAERGLTFTAGQDRRICQRHTCWLHPTRQRPLRHDR